MPKEEGAREQERGDPELGPEGQVSQCRDWEARLCLQCWKKGRGPVGHKTGPEQSKRGAEQEAVGTGRWWADGLGPCELRGVCGVM